MAMQRQNDVLAIDSADRSEAGRVLVDKRSAFLGFLVRRLGNRADAEDVLQDFCLRVLARKEQLRDATRMDAWLYSILRSTLNDFFRRSGRRERLGEAFAREARLSEVSDDAAEALAQMCHCVFSLLDGLRPVDAELIRRVDIEDQDRAQVASDLGLTRGAMAVRLHRARVALRDRMLNHCGCCCEDGFDDCSCSTSGTGQTVA